MDRPARTLAAEPFFMQLIGGIQIELDGSPFSLMMRSAEDREVETATYQRWHAERRVDGVLLVDLRRDDPRLPYVKELGLPAEKLERLGAKLGSDVPFCVAGGTALAEGRGEILTALPDLPPLYLVLAKPGLEISTPWAYREFDKQKNVVHPDIEGMVKAVRAGSGPTVFGFVKEKKAGEEIAALLQSMQMETAVAELVGRQKV